MAACCAERCSGQVKTLSVVIALFSLIAFVQFFFALYAHSNALLVDCASMAVDTLTYAGSLWGACATADGGGAGDGGARRALATSCASIVVLYGVTAWGLAGAVRDLLARDLDDDLDAAVVLAFGVFGLVFDAAAVFAFRVFVDGDDGGAAGESAGDGEDRGVMLRTWDDDDDGIGDRASGVMLRTWDRGDGGDGEAPALARSADDMNMCSAFSHVLADCIRSVTSIALGLAVLLDPRLNGARWDAYATVVISSTILLGSTALAGDWCRLACGLRGAAATTGRGRESRRARRPRGAGSAAGSAAGRRAPDRPRLVTRPRSTVSFLGVPLYTRAPRPGPRSRGRSR